ncbi:diacylglycerol/lipid kinase family protein [Hyphomicrobium facile]|uniref:Diacylglycerol kinase family enzyme n=1 Tax=Hyphomicrobium facile TaxID=51670 RepID=A0A1I7NH23_9HYPH|nr:diacylglycerol kinase family protein [Hyphomicrobium facile]SFV33952.1 Diacylglycerol kinase family enzyme [Hyphomicrobium facile]
MRRRFALVFNSTAGVAIPRLLDGVIRSLRHSQAEVFQVPARSSAEASERVADLARRSAADAVIAAGGDGTFRAVATGAAGTSLPVGLVPLGTGNVLAAEIGLPKGVQALADVLLTGEQIEMRGGLANGEPFFLMLGAGFDARVVAKLSYRTKRAFGRGAYVYPVIRTFAEAHPVFDVELDGRRFEASWVILSFATRYGSLFTLAPDAGVGRDTLIAVVMEAGSRRAIGANLLSLALGWLARPETRLKGVHVLPVKAATIGRRERTHFQVDGDEGGMSPVEVRADGPRVRLIVPPRYVADLTNCHANRLAYEV